MSNIIQLLKDNREIINIIFVKLYSLYKNYIAIIKYITFANECLVMIKLKIRLSFGKFIIFRQRFAIRDVSLSECDNDDRNEDHSTLFTSS